MYSQVSATEKLLMRDRGGKSSQRSSKTSSKAGDEPPMATTLIIAPTVLVLCRRDSENKTSFLSVFYVCPTGTGSSRFMSAGVARSSISIPRWVSHLAHNGFLDQDTMLVASQQPRVLEAEAQGKRRQDLFLYQSPTDRNVRRIDQFWDATLVRAPNRRKTLLQGQPWKLPDRTLVLDRKTQHLDVCPDSQAVVRNCGRILNAGFLTSLAWVALKLMKLPRTPTMLQSVAWPIVATLSAFFASFIRRGFFYKYTRDLLVADLKKIPTKIWAD
jgi:hypothetical protein